MSGYTPKKMQTAKLVHQPANMMVAGLAPRIGKSGASIRLYWQRIEECCNCVAEPIKILKRGIFPGDTVSGSWRNGLGQVTVNVHSDLNAGIVVPRQRNIYYVIVFNQTLTSPIGVEAAIAQPGATLELATATGVDWSNGNITNSNVYSISIPDTDFQLLDFGDNAAPVPNNTTIGISSSGWHIYLDGSTTTLNGPGNIPAADLPPAWDGNSINYNIGTAGLPVAVSSNTASMVSNAGCLNYLVTNPSWFGGPAIIFNITRLLIASSDMRVIPGTGPPAPLSGPLDDWTGYVALTDILKATWRQGLANITWFNGNTPPDRNNIGIAYASNPKSVLYSKNNCDFSGPMADFKIAAGGPAAPVLELIEDATW